MSVNSEKGSSKADTLIKVVLVFFISLLSFSVGTFVGHQFSKSEQRRMALEGEYKAERGIASTNAEDGEKISEKEVESLTEEFVNKERAGAHEPVDTSENEVNDHGHAEAKPAAHDNEGYKAVPRAKKADGHAATDAHAVDSHAVAPAPAAAPAHGAAAAHNEADAHAAPAKHGDDHATDAKTAKTSAAKPGAHKDGVHDAADKVAKGEAPTDGAKEPRKPSSALPSVASSAIGKYTVQVASYSEENEAKNHAASLKSKGWATAFYALATVQGRTWYRVSVGLYDTNKDATEARVQFMKDTGTKAALVQKVVQ